MIVFRISKKIYRHDLSGKGAEIAGGRWNNKGTAILYTATIRALCMSEVLVHQPSGLLPDDFWITQIEVPDTAPITALLPTDLPQNWDAIPPSPISKSVGDAFVAAREFLGLLVPSVVVKGEQNLLLNPLHPLFFEIKIADSEPFVFDPRLVRF